MSKPRWHRSLYWRIGLGLFAFLALMLAAHGALFLWTTDRIAGSMPATSPQRLADLVASDISTALAEEPALDLQQYVRENYGNVFQTFVVVMRDGRTVSNHDDLPQALRDGLRAEAQRRPPPQLLGVPDRLAPVLVGQDDQAVIHRLLSEEIERSLAELSSAPSIKPGQRKGRS